MNSAGYSEIEQPITAFEKHYPLFQYILNQFIKGSTSRLVMNSCLWIQLNEI